MQNTNMVVKKEEHGMVETIVTEILNKNSQADKALIMGKLNMILARTPKMAGMQPHVIATAMLKAMIPDPTLQDHGDIYFIPYGQTIDVMFSHNYLQKLAYRNGAVKLIEPYIITTNDTVSVTEKGVTFSINPFGEEGDFVGVLVLVKLRNNETKYGFVSKSHIELARKASKASGGGPWKTWYYEMAKKVAIKNTLKGIDISTEFNDAVDIDNENMSTKESTQLPPSNSAADDLVEAMTVSSSNIAEKEKRLVSLGVEYEVKGDWIKIDQATSNADGISKLEGLMTLVSKDNQPGYMFGKITEMKE